MFYLIISTVALVIGFIVYCSIDTGALDRSKEKLSSAGYNNIFHGTSDNFIAFNIETGRLRMGNLRYYQYFDEPISLITKCKKEYREVSGVKKERGCPR